MQPTVKILRGDSEEEIWSQLQEDVKDDIPFVDNYEVVVKQQDTTVQISIEIDFGGGFESGFESTTFVSQLYLAKPFHFLLQREGFLVEVGKLLGMEDVEIGDLEFDERVRIKTNDVDRIKQVLHGQENKTFIQSWESYELSLSSDTDDPHILVFKLQLEEAIVNPTELRTYYHVFRSLLKEIDA